SPGLMAAKRRAFLGRQHRNFMRAARFCLPRMQSADGVLDSRYARVQLRHVAGALVGAQQVTTLHVRKPWAALAIVPDRTCRADRQLRFANASHPIHRARIEPDLFKALSPQIPRRDGHLDAGKDVAVGRDVAAVVPRGTGDVVIRLTLYAT